MKRLSCLLVILGTVGSAKVIRAGEVRIGDRTFTVPDGFEISVAADSSLAGRPISAAFDERGRLYVTESSGSNDNVQTQLKERPHRVLRLEDADGDGRFDRRTVFADQMMLPQGAMWHAGSLYVAAPPSIWKLTDVDDDGVADRREEWFEGKTLTGCANDLHGPYLGPDGWIYWCKGAFAEQTYPRPGKEPLVTKASHIFRRRPEGGVIESVMTGGMDNPVELVFTPEGERIFNCTFFQHPAGGQRDGLIHAIYGGVYGKPHYVLDGHPRTGDLMPVLAHLGAAAPSALFRIESAELGAEYQNNLLCCLFNMQKVTRHQLVAKGAAYETVDSDFVVCDHRDFHPTDVLEDADGSILVVDTGGWYKLCCPTSQLWKPDILGGIYRVRRTGAHQASDPRGEKIAWDKATPMELVSLLDDKRPVVRKKAGDQLRALGAKAVKDLAAVVDSSASADARQLAVWTLVRIGDDDALAAIRKALRDRDEHVRHAAVHALSVTLDKNGVDELIAMLQSPSVFNRRAAAEALGRLGDKRAIGPLLEAVREDGDRALEHSLIYAVIEIGDPEATLSAADVLSAPAKRAAMIAVSQMPGNALSQERLLSLLNSSEASLRRTGYWILQNSSLGQQALPAEFAPTVVRRFCDPQASDSEREELGRLLARSTDALEASLEAGLGDENVGADRKLQLLRVVSENPPKKFFDSWQRRISQLLTAKDVDPAAIVNAVKGLTRSDAHLEPTLRDELQRISDSDDVPPAVRLQALACFTNKQPLQPQAFELAVENLSSEAPVETRQAAADVLAKAVLAPEQHLQLADVVPTVGPLELERIVETVTRSRDPRVAPKLIENLQKTPTASSIERSKLVKALSAFGPDFKKQIDELSLALDRALESRSQGLGELLEQMPQGDIRRGQAVFNSAKASCSACHAFGYLGGRIGPDLTRIGQIRTRRDLLEAIVFPSASFVRSYEPVVVLRTDGTVATGVVKEDSDARLVLVTTERKEIVIPRDEVEAQRPGTVSIMPNGLEQQLTRQELADLIAFLESAR